jgi:hypothetical protein
MGIINIYVNSVEGSAQDLLYYQTGKYEMKRMGVFRIFAGFVYGTPDMIGGCACFVSSWRS